MRIITGKYKGQKILGVPGISTRPTTAFNRETIFSMYPHYEGYRVLDLFAGTGAFGLECLSRGAEWVDFVEFATPAIATIRRIIEWRGFLCRFSCGSRGGFPAAQANQTRRAQNGITRAVRSSGPVAFHPGVDSLTRAISGRKTPDCGSANSYPPYSNAMFR